MKIIDLVVREAYVYLFEGSLQSTLFLIEMLFSVILPFVMLLYKKVRQSPKLIFTAAALYVVLGVALNRVNVFIIAYMPPFTEVRYYPAIGEIFVTAGLISTLMLVYRFIVQNFPVIAGHPQKS